MRRLARHHTKPQRHRTVTRTLTACIVDPQVDDYQGWQPTADANGLQLKFIATADEALRIARAERVDLWVINTALPSLGGAELCNMLRAQGNRGAVYLVADEYTPQAEHAAWGSRATMFLCKPAHHDILAGWLARARGVPRAHSNPTQITV